MAITHISASQSNATSTAATLTITRTPGSVNNLLVIAFLSNGATQTLSIADTAGNSWNILNPRTADVPNSSEMQSWWALANGTSSTVITVTCSGTNTFRSILFDEFSGTDLTTPVNGHNEGIGTGTPSKAVTPSVDNCAMWGASADSVTAVAASYTKGGDDANQDWSEWRILTGGNGVSQTVSFTGSGNWVMLAAAFQPVQSIPPIVAPFFDLTPGSCVSWSNN